MITICLVFCIKRVTFKAHQPDYNTERDTTLFSFGDSEI